MRTSRRPARNSGFSLIELMIAVAIVAIIVAVALPAFQGSIRKSRRTEATNALNAAMQAQERWRANSPSYCTLLLALPTDAPPGLGQLASTPNGYYAISMDAATVDQTGYTVVATAVAGTSQADDGNCARLRVRIDKGNIFYGSAPTAGAWEESTTNRCWSR